MFTQVSREDIFWRIGLKCSLGTKSSTPRIVQEDIEKTVAPQESVDVNWFCKTNISPAPWGQKIQLYNVAHSRVGDKGNDLNFSIVPHFPSDVERLKLVITPQWVLGVVSALPNLSSFLNSNAINKRECWVHEHVKVEIYEVKGIHSLNVVVRNILDGGVNCSRRIDRHGKTISDLILCQRVVLPPYP